jgi:hypothetical protein
MPRSKEELAQFTAQLVAAYQEGASLKQLERRFGVAASHAGRLIKRAGVALRPPGREDPDAYHGTLGKAARYEYLDRLRQTKPPA